MKFYKCAHCGNIIAFVEDKGVPVMCCGEKMSQIAANTTDASAEKHVPVITVNENKVTVHVGSADHPMVQEHHIDWIALQTKQGNQRKELSVDGAPEVVFAVCEDDSVIAAYAYCNLHGLWTAQA